MRALTFLTLPVVLGSALFWAQPAAAETDLAGSWSVKLTETGPGTCAQTPGRVSSYVWLVSTQPDGTVVVNVQGDTPFKKLGGRIEGDTLVLHAYAVIDGRTDATWIKVKVAGGQLFGIRRHLSVQPQQFSTSRVTAPCFLDLDVSGKKTG